MTVFIGNLLIFIGALTILIATIGLLRFEDLYIKMHAATKVGVLGCSLILLGVALQLGNIHSLTEVLLLILFIAITNPISAHLLGRIAYSANQ